MRTYTERPTPAPPADVAAARRIAAAAIDTARKAIEIQLARLAHIEQALIAGEDPDWIALAAFSGATAATVAHKAAGTAACAISNYAGTTDPGNRPSRHATVTRWARETAEIADVAAQEARGHHLPPDPFDRLLQAATSTRRIAELAELGA